MSLPMLNETAPKPELPPLPASPEVAPLPHRHEAEPDANEAAAADGLIGGFEFKEEPPTRLEQAADRIKNLLPGRSTPPKIELATTSDTEAQPALPRLAPAAVDKQPLPPAPVAKKVSAPLPTLPKPVAASLPPRSAAEPEAPAPVVEPEVPAPAVVKPVVVAAAKPVRHASPAPVVTPKASAQRRSRADALAKADEGAVIRIPKAPKALKTPKPAREAAKPVRAEAKQPRERLSGRTVLLLGGLALASLANSRKDRLQNFRARRQAANRPGFAARAAQIKNGVNEKPLEYFTRTKTRLMVMNEKGNDHKGLLAGAIGVVLVSGLAYVAYKGLHHSSGTEVADNVPKGSGGAAAHHPGAAVNHPGSQIGPHVPAHPHQVPGQHTPVTHGPAHHAPVSHAPSHHTPTHRSTALHSGSVVTVRHGDGFTNVVNNYALQHGQHLSGAQNYRLYQQLHEHFGNHILNTDVYNLPHGDIGLRHAGPATWNPQAQEFMDDLLKAAKKKKGLS
ncbi:MAG: hypothetical protein QFB87_04375 [Patescibacteria group bacterium]|nr:hypothetical protein [Patescibacteria group bacterium]